MNIYLYGGFLLLVVGLLAFDLGVLNRKAHAISFKEALMWTGFWVSLALSFTFVVYYFYEHKLFGLGGTSGAPVNGLTAAMEFVTAYLVEESLSLDNMFLIALIFTYFGVPRSHQHRVLYWGILGALVMRGIMIAAGAALIHRFSWMTYVFGGLLLLTAIKLFFSREDKFDPEQALVIRLARRVLPVSHEVYTGRFFTRIDGKRAVTTMFLVLLLVETTDVIFAVDSIPAVFAVTRDPFIVFTSNVFAILGLRSLYFVLADIMDRFKYLKNCLVILLAFVAGKMLIAHYYKIPTPISLGIIALILGTGIVVSMLASRKSEKYAGKAAPH